GLVTRKHSGLENQLSVPFIFQIEELVREHQTHGESSRSGTACRQCRFDVFFQRGTKQAVIVHHQLHIEDFIEIEVIGMKRQLQMPHGCDAVVLEQAKVVRRNPESQRIISQIILRQRHHVRRIVSPDNASVFPAKLRQPNIPEKARNRSSSGNPNKHQLYIAELAEVKTRMFPIEIFQFCLKEAFPSALELLEGHWETICQTDRLFHRRLLRLNGRGVIQRKEVDIEP